MTAAGGGRGDRRRFRQYPGHLLRPAFHRLARAAGLVGPGIPVAKRAMRDAVRQAAGRRHRPGRNSRPSLRAAHRRARPAPGRAGFPRPMLPAERGSPSSSSATRPSSPAGIRAASAAPGGPGLDGGGGFLRGGGLGPGSRSASAPPGQEKIAHIRAPRLHPFHRRPGRNCSGNRLSRAEVRGSSMRRDRRAE